MQVIGSGVAGLSTLNISTSAIASFADTLTIRSTDVADGQAGSFSFSLLVSGVIDGTRGIAANWSLQAVSTNGSVSQVAIGKGGKDAPGAYVGDPFGRYTGRIDFVYGRPFDLSVQLGGSASTLGSADEASFDLSHSLYWDGVSDVLANGAPVRTFGIGSASGTDYRFSMAPVPEPATALPLLPGLLLVTMRRLAGRATTWAAPAPA